MRLSPKLRAVFLRLSLKQPKTLLQPRRISLPIKDFWRYRIRTDQKTLRKIVLVDVVLGCTLTVWFARQTIRLELSCI